MPDTGESQVTHDRPKAGETTSDSSYLDDEVMAQYRADAERGDPEAQHALSHACVTNFDVDELINATEALKWLRRAAEQNHADSQCDLGRWYERGYFYDGLVSPIAQDESAAAAWYRKAAEQGHPQSQCKLGVMYVEGRGVSQDIQAGLNWLRQAAVQDDAEANSQLAKLYHSRSGTTEKGNEAKTVARLLRDAEQGDAEAQFQLGRQHNSVNSPVTDRKESKKEALRWFQKAAEQGHVEAQYWTGLYYRYGLEVVAEDKAESDVWFSKAAEKGHTGAMRKLGRYREAADLGDASAQYQLGNQYLEENDPTEAMNWYLKAVNNPDGLNEGASTAGIASYQIAKMYEEGKGVTQNDETALSWLFKAAEKGDTEAPWDIARRYARGIGVPKDAALAAKWYVEAESRGQDFEWEGLNKTCEARGLSLEEMLAAYRKAAETCEAWADYLADLYEYGYGVVTPDKAESQKWRRKVLARFFEPLAGTETEGGGN
jgi:TPR repeat protein